LQNLLDGHNQVHALEYGLILEQVLSQSEGSHTGFTRCGCFGNVDAHYVPWWIVAKFVNT